MRLLLLTAALTLPGLAFAAGGGSSSAPKTTPTTTECPQGKIFDTKTETCVDPSFHDLNDTQRIDAVRELAHAGRIAEAVAVLDTVRAQDSDMALTYRGFTARQMGKMGAAKAAYEKAIAINPDNILARSYMGQGMVTTGDLVGARGQLVEIRARGGAGTWAEQSLDTAIRTGIVATY